MLWSLQMDPNIVANGDQRIDSLIKEPAASSESQSKSKWNIFQSDQHTISCIVA